MSMIPLSLPDANAGINDTIVQRQQRAVATLINKLENTTDDMLWAPIAQAQFDTTFGAGKLLYLRGVGFAVYLNGYLHHVEFGDGLCVNQQDMRLNVQPLRVG